MVGAIDASLAAQNMTLAAESMGMGACYIGGIRDEIEVISEILALPDYVYPLYGLALGYPLKKNELKPRFPQEAIHHHDGYDTETLPKTLAYERLTSTYYAKRTNGTFKRIWSETAFKTLTGLPRLHMKNFLEKRGLGRH